MTDTFEEHGDKPNGVKPIYRLKCVVVGDLGVGKTTLVRSFAEGPRTRSIAAEPKSMWQKEIKMATYIVSLSIWDTAGMDIFFTFEKSNFGNNWKRFSLFVHCYMQVKHW